MQAVLNNGEAGLKIPKLLPQNLTTFVAIVLSAVMAAIVLAVTQPGSALALCFLLPFGLVLKDWLAKPRSSSCPCSAHHGGEWLFSEWRWNLER